MSNSGRCADQFCRTRSRHYFRDPDAAGLIFLVEARMLRAVDIQHRQQFTVADDGDNDFAVRRAVAGDVAGEGVNIFHQLNLSRLGRHAANAGTEGNADAGRTALEWPEHKLSTDIAIKAGPIDVGQAFPDQSRRIGHIGEAVGLAVDQPLKSRGQIAVKRGLVRSLDLEIVHQSQLTFPRPALIALRPFF